MKKYIIIAGVNGAGKSTLYQVIEEFQNIPRVNIDDIVRENGDWRNAADVMKAGKIAVGLINEYFDKQYSFNQETTLCGNSIMRNIDKAKTLGYYIELHYVGIDSVSLAKQRIAYRVEHGGHGIPDADVERRYYESLRNLKVVIDKCDQVIIYDNTVSFRRFAIYQNGKETLVSGIIPNWYIEWKNMNSTK